MYLHGKPKCKIATFRSPGSCLTETKPRDWERLTWRVLFDLCESLNFEKMSKLDSSSSPRIYLLLHFLLLFLAMKVPTQTAKSSMTPEFLSKLKMKSSVSFLSILALSPLATAQIPDCATSCIFNAIASAAPACGSNVLCQCQPSTFSAIVNASTPYVIEACPDPIGSFTILPDPCCSSWLSPSRAQWSRLYLLLCHRSRFVVTLSFCITPNLCSEHIIVLDCSSLKFCCRWNYRQRPSSFNVSTYRSQFNWFNHLNCGYKQHGSDKHSTTQLLASK